ncbi:hypothetical protein PR048_017250 [Dryococelus australis]|uniref:Uncharacterized protein n=1 Tax=Dryococelus australis TaxID=614101 RepID=A0ABQ9H910_9NEOP|nr:hypothetical protein PR048_017250 [Dryococelus australis]
MGEQGDDFCVFVQWELSVTYLGLLEGHLHKCLDHFPQGEGLDSYSFLCLDPAWDMLQRGGRWSSTHLDVVGCLHQNFNSCPALTEVMVR